MFIDSHSHIYSSDFVDDLQEVIKRAEKAGVKKIILPNIDSGSIQDMLKVSSKFSGVCFPLIGLHPTSVNGSYKNELELVEEWLGKEKFYGVGEIGIDLYWDKTYLKEQELALTWQIKLAKEASLPIVIHVRDSFNEVFNIVEEEQDGNLKGIFHCFAGSIEEAWKIIGLGFKLGIGGVVTFKNSNLKEVLKEIDINHLVLETDSPYLAPVPFRGKRNESAYIQYIAKQVAGIYQLPIDKVAEITSKNVEKLFNI